ncbi:MAG TPA: iron transporter [Solirubrobacteraceae bacterium]|nr:iron transporter [Solirubrobacteraceae bacterium]
MSIRTPRRIAAALLAGALLSGCASADKNAGAASTPSTTKTSGASTSNMSGMNMGQTVATEVPSVGGIKPVTIRTLATSYWQDMEIQAQTMTPTTFVVFDNGTEITHRPPKNSSFHLMIMLTDRHTHFQIAYAAVWATIINSAGKVVYNSSQWPMNSEYMGIHYGNNVPHLPAGRYTLKLLISPPEEGRHLEYAHMWLKQHTVVQHFSWNPNS